MIKAGYARLDATPPLGNDISGYFHRRLAKGVLDPLYIIALAVRSGDSTALIIAADYIGIGKDEAKEIRGLISERTGVGEDAVFISALHQHTSPCIADPKMKLTALRDEEFKGVLYRKFADAAVMAIDDLSDCEISYGEAPTKEPIAFVRRYFTDDGSVVTNPKEDVTITARCAEADNTVRVVKIKRQGTYDIALVNFSTHPDVIGGEYFSADWPGFTRRFVEEGIENTRAIFLTGTQGDSNHIDFFKPKNERLVGKGYAHSEYMGRTVADAVISLWDTTSKVEGEQIFSKISTVYNKTNQDGIEKYDEYKAWYDDFNSGRLGYYPHITDLAYASRIVKLRTASIFRPVPISMIGIGKLLFVGFGGEAFTYYGEAMRKMFSDRIVVCAVCTNGYEGYLPTEKAFAEGGYEASSSLFTHTLEKEILAEAEKMIN